MLIEQLYLIGTLEAAWANYQSVIRLNDSTHVKFMEYRSEDEPFVRITDKNDRLHLVPLTFIKEMLLVPVNPKDKK